ncbi:S1 family peptidase [Vibrio vulnificus]
MKTLQKTILASIITLASSPVFALGGNMTSVAWESQNNIVGFYGGSSNYNCTGTVIGGNKVLTAMHCGWESAGGVRDVFSYNKNGSVRHKVVNTNGVDEPDLAIWELEGSPKVSDFYPISLAPVSLDAQVGIIGFGGTRKQLNSGSINVFNIGYDNSYFEAIDSGNGHTVSGDSGSPALVNNQIVGILSSGINTADGKTSTYSTVATETASQHLLDWVDSWHYPTFFEYKEEQLPRVETIKVQSLHVQSVGDIANLLTTTGDVLVNIEEIQCVNGLGAESDASNVQSYDVCTIPVSVNGSGSVVLADTQQEAMIEFAVEPETPTEPEVPQIGGGSSSSGGSIGMLGLLGLFGFGFLRKLKR